MHDGGLEVQSHAYCGAGVGGALQPALHTSAVVSQPGSPFLHGVHVHVVLSHLAKAFAWQFTAQSASVPPHPGVAHGMHLGGCCVQSHEYSPPLGVGAGGAPQCDWQIWSVSVQPGPSVHVLHAPSTHLA